MVVLGPIGALAPLTLAASALVPLVSCIVLALDPRNRSLGDRLARTLVVDSTSVAPTSI